MVSRRVVTTAALAAATLTLGACSLGARLGAGEDDAASGQSKTATIVVIAPLTGPDAGRGLGVRNAVQLAVDQANASGAVPGWTLSVEAIDDENQPAQSKAAAQKATQDDQVVAVIGSIYSGVTKEMLPVLSQAGMPALSPSATNPTLTKGDAYATKPARPFRNFYRLTSPDDAHGPAVAKYLAEKGVTTVATVDDGDTYGAGLVEAFTEAYSGKVVSHDTVEPGKGTYPQLVAELRKSKPQAVFFGGYDTEAAPISLALKQAGLSIPVAGGDGLATDAYIPMSGPISAGDISTSAGNPVSSVEAGKRFLADYKASRFAEGASSYGPLAYDAGNAVVKALSTTLTDSVSSPKQSRAATVEALATVSFDGTSGKVAFDAFGDVTPRVVTVNELAGGAWQPAATYNF